MVVHPQAEAGGSSAPGVEGGAAESGVPKGGGSVLAFENCSWEIEKKGAKQYILHGVSGTVEAGEVLAILGPSGAGKTTLMNLLTSEAFAGTPSGSVTLNGAALTPAVYTEHSAFVQQADRLWAFLTCRETVELATRLYIPEDGAARAARVDRLLSRMGLVECQHTRVGNALFQGLSGGQKRRLSIAVALAKSPTLVFLDEPTSGLDAASAAGIMAFLKEIATAERLIIVCTIHQPSSKVYAGFDQTMVLSSGRLAFRGAASSTVPYLERIGRPVPANSNPAEHLLDLVNHEFASPTEVEAVLEAFQAHGQPLTPPPAASELPSRAGYGVGLGSQTMTLLKRHTLITVRDPMLYTGRLVAFIFVNVFFGIVYVKSRDRVQDQALNRMFLIPWMIGVPACFSVIAVYVYNLEYFAVKKEIKDGMYSPAAYLLANAILQLPLIFVISFFALCVGTYGIANYDAGGMPTMVCIFAACLWSFECCAQFFAVAFADPLVGMLGFMNVWFANFLFSGMFIAAADVVWPFRLFCYILPLGHSMTAMIYTEYHKKEWSGAVLDATDARGFSCDADVSTMNCYGRTGLQVLDSLHDNYDMVRSSDVVGEKVLYVILAGLFFKACYAAVLVLKTRGSSAKLKPAAASS